jgi:hypothetical protein
MSRHAIGPQSLRAYFHIPSYLNFLKNIHKAGLQGSRLYNNAMLQLLRDTMKRLQRASHHRAMQYREVAIGRSLCLTTAGRGCCAEGRNGQQQKASKRRRGDSTSCSGGGGDGGRLGAVRQQPHDKRSA